MSSRESILQRLEKVCPSGKAPGTMPALPSSKEIYCDYPEENLLATFQRKIQALKGECTLSASMEELARELGRILDSVPPGTIVAQDLPLIRAVLQRLPNGSREVRRFEKWGQTNDEFASYAASITTADALIARTGSVVLRSTSAGGRRLSVLPPVHIVLATTSQIWASHEDWFKEIEHDESWSFGTIISGPSRTGDIEKILVLGAHGPKRLIICLLNDHRA